MATALESQDILRNKNIRSQWTEDIFWKGFSCFSISWPYAKAGDLEIRVGLVYHLPFCFSRDLPWNPLGHFKPVESEKAKDSKDSSLHILTCAYLDPRNLAQRNGGFFFGSLGVARTGLRFPSMLSPWPKVVIFLRVFHGSSAWWGRWVVPFALCWWMLLNVVGIVFLSCLSCLVMHLFWRPLQGIIFSLGFWLWQILVL